MHIPIQLIVGLGNPGSQYEDTRHNAGAWFVNEIARKYQTDLHLEIKFHGFYGTFQIEDYVCKLLMPTTFMNCSGRAVRAIANFYKIPHKAILIAHDELDFKPGIARLKFDGGHNGQKGLQDIITQLGDEAFYRLRIGIGRSQHKDIASYVLSKPSIDERMEIDNAIRKAITILPNLLAGQMQSAMQLLHDTRSNQ